MESCTATRRTAPTPIPLLATGCTPNEDLTVWTCTLRDDVTFQDGSTFEAKDVLVSSPPSGMP